MFITYMNVLTIYFCVVRHPVLNNLLDIKEMDLTKKINLILCISCKESRGKRAILH